MSALASDPGPLEGRTARWRASLPTGATALARVGGGRPWLAIVAVAVLVLAWPVRTSPRYTVDVSWQLGLHQAAEQGLRFGQEIVFTYGPLGFLSRPTPFIGPTSVLALVATALVYLAAAGTLLLAARRLFPMAAAVVVTLLCARAFGFIEPFEVLLVVVFAIGVDLLRRDRVARPGWVAVAAGVLAGILVLGKLNDGVFAAAMAVIVVLAVTPNRPWGLLSLAAAFAASTLALWLATSQHLTDLVPYARASIDIISGYSDAMVRTTAGRRWILVLVAFMFEVALLSWIAWQASRGWSSGRRLALAGLLFLLLFAGWKFAFVRNHVAPTFVTLAFATLVLLPARLPRRIVMVALIIVGVAFFGVSGVSPSSYVGMPTSVTELARQVRDGLPWQWDAAAARTRRRLQAVFHVPPGILAQLDGHTVHVDPHAAAVVSAYPGIRWRPEPIFQSYSAYAPSLDGLNADLLRSPERPERILRQFGGHGQHGERWIPYAIDGRFYWFESPAATIERLCRYRQVAADGGWQVLADTGGQCGPPQPISSVTARRGESVDVPPAPAGGDIVFVRIYGVDDGLLGRLRSALWRSPQWYVRLDGFRYRLVPGTTMDGLVLAVPASAQGSAPFSFGPPVRTVAVEPKGSGEQLRYEFYAQPLPGQ